MDQIIAMNSETLTDENSTIRVGDKLIITVPQPELSVERMEQNYYEEIYDADVIYVDNDSWYTTQTKILQQPSAGFRRVVADVSYLNDREVTRDILKEEVVMEADSSDLYQAYFRWTSEFQLRTQKVTYQGCQQLP